MIELDITEENLDCVQCKSHAVIDRHYCLNPNCKKLFDIEKMEHSENDSMNFTEIIVFTTETN